MRCKTGRDDVLGGSLCWSLEAAAGVAVWTGMSTLVAEVIRGLPGGSEEVIARWGGVLLTAALDSLLMTFAGIAVLEKRDATLLR